MILRAAMLLFLTSGLAQAQVLTVTFRNTMNLGSIAQDQFGQSFTVAGMSGLARRMGNEYWAVMDNSNKLVKLTVSVTSNGSISSAAISGGLSMDTTRDFEGIAFDVTPGSPDVWLSEETTPAIHRFDFSTGSLLAQYAAPSVFSSVRPNRGLESLTRRHDAPGFWTANEEALTVDGPISSPSSGTVIRLVRYDSAGGTFMPGPQYPHLTEPWHGSSVSGAQGGVPDLVALPDGRLLLMERSLAFSLSGLFQTRIYVLNFAGATDVSAIPGLIGQPYSLVAKTLLYQGDQQNLEGLCLGPALGPGRFSLLGIVDDGDPISVNRVVAFELSGVGSACYPNCDASTASPLLSANDFQCFLNAFAAGLSFANCDGSTAAPTLTPNDFQCFLDRYASGC